VLLVFTHSFLSPAVDNLGTGWLIFRTAGSRVRNKQPTPTFQRKPKQVAGEKLFLQTLRRRARTYESFGAAVTPHRLYAANSVEENVFDHRASWRWHLAPFSPEEKKNRS
jgi:hypothetical protein